jgi:predicted permease
MSWILGARTRLAQLLGRAAAEERMDEEIRFHIEMEAEKNRRAGMSPAEARRRARIAFGGVEGHREEMRAGRRAGWVEDLALDLRYAARVLRRSPGYSAVVVLTLALGIAANTTVFSILNPYLLRPLPFGDAGRLVQLGQVDPLSGWDAARFSLPQYRDWAERSEAFEGLAAYHYGPRNLTGDGEPEQALVGVVTGNLFPILRSPPALGRTLTAADGGPAGADVVVLGHGIWTRRFGADPAVVGRSIQLDGAPHTVVGVMPPDFNFPWNEVRMWVPMRADPAAAPRTETSHILVGRLKPGWSAAQARQELESIQRELGALHPEADGRFGGVTVRPLREALNFAWDVVRISLLVLLTAVGAVLLIACVNVAGLTLARATVRTREVAVRMALGAGRGRLVRQLVTESVVLALAGGALGLLLTFAAVSVIGPALPEALYRVGTASVDGRVLGFTLALTLLTPLLFGLSPALAALRTDLARTLKEGGQAAGAGRGAMRARRALVVTQVALAVVLVTVAGLMIRSFLAVRDVELGFRADRLLALEVAPPASAYGTPEALAAYYDRALDALAALPGVRAASAANVLPLNHEEPVLQFAPPEAAEAPPEEWPVALESRTAPGYLDAMGIPLLAGRDFHPADAPGVPPVVIVSRALAERSWPGQDPVGRTVLLGGSGTAATVVGVAGDVRHTDLTGEIRPHLYRPLTQAPARRRFLVVAAEAGSPAALGGAARAALAAVDPDLPLTARPMTEVVRESSFQWSIGSLALSVFGSVALLLAALGLYGTAAFSVAQRRRELGIRAALGASTRQLRRLVLGEGLRLTATGIGVGAALALLAGRLLSSQLYGVAAFDPVTLAAMLALFAAVTVGATLRPAQRAASVPPQEALREE